jgi:hypothetical protein
VAKTISNTRPNLMIPESLVTRVEKECAYVGISKRVYLIEDHQIKSRTSFVSLMIRTHCNTLLSGYYDSLQLNLTFDEPTKPLPFYLDTDCFSAVNAVLSQDLAPSVHHIGTHAIANYFLREDAALRKNRGLYEMLMALPPTEIIKTIRAGGALEDLCVLK